jgi:hypothetical protein
LQPYAGNTAKILTKPEIKFAAWSPETEIRTSSKSSTKQPNQLSTVIPFSRLFEIRVLHEYYLLGQNAATFFDKPAVDRAAIFSDRILNQQYLVSRDLIIEPSAPTMTTLKGLQWRFAQTPAGFVVGAATKTISANGSSITQPAIQPRADTDLFFIVRNRNPYFSNFTSLPLTRGPLPFRYYFSNRPACIQGADFATLSVQSPDFDAAKSYEMGQTAFKDGMQQEFAPSSDPNVAPWRPAPGAGFVNEGDNMALPKVFDYQFKQSDNIQQAVVRLQNSANQDVKVINLTSTKPLGTVRLDFSAYPDPLQNNIKITIPDGLYQLIIDAGPIQENRTVFLSDLYQARAFAIIHISFAEPDPTYRILNADGSIRSVNTVPHHPVFEIRLRSRFTFWRYISRYRDQNLAVNPTMVDYLEAEGNNVITKVPQVFSFLPAGLHSTDDNAHPPVFKLPTPLPDLIRPKPPNQLYFSEVSTWKIAGLID